MRLNVRHVMGRGEIARTTRGRGVAALVLLMACGEDAVPSIAQARGQTNGTSAIIEGYVTAPPGAFESAMGNPGFVLQDDTGGIYVKVATRLAFGLGTRVRVLGVLAEEARFRLLVAETSMLQPLAGPRQITPVDVKTGTVGEATEGQLVRVTGRVTRTFEDDAPYGYKLYVNDGSGEVQIFVHLFPGVPTALLKGLTLAQTITVTGVSAQYESTYEVAPRQASDILVK